MDIECGGCARLGGNQKSAGTQNVQFENFRKLHNDNLRKNKKYQIILIQNYAVVRLFVSMYTGFSFIYISSPFSICSKFNMIL